MKFTIGSVFGLAFSVMGKRVGTLLAVNAIIYIGLSILAFLVAFAIAGLFHIGDSPLMAVLPMLIGYLVLAALWNAMTAITLLHVLGKPVRIEAVLRNTLINAFPVLLIALFWFFGFFIGLFLLLVPGTIFAVTFAVTVPAFVYEKTSIFGAFSRSMKLTEGHRWGIFGMNLLVNLGLYIGGAIYMFAATAVGMGLFRSTEISEGAAAVIAIAIMFGSMALFTFLPVLNTSLYVVLRADKGEPITIGIEKVFE